MAKMLARDEAHRIAAERGEAAALSKPPNAGDRQLIRLSPARSVRKFQIFTHTFSQPAPAAVLQQAANFSGCDRLRPLSENSIGSVIERSFLITAVSRKQTL